MGLFRPLNEGKKGALAAVESNNKCKENCKTGMFKGQHDVFKNSEASKKHFGERIKKQLRESTVSLLGLTDEEITALEEGCNSDTCKCKGGTCPVKTTDGISTSSAAASTVITM